MKLTTKQQIKKKAIYVGLSILYAVSFGWLTIGIFNVSNGNVLLASILNLVAILLFVIGEKFERMLERKLLKIEKKEGSLSLPLKLIKGYIGGPSFKASLYFYYVVVLVGVAILAADPYIAFLYGWSGYFLSVQYGVLFLIAVDKFLDRITKDIKREGEVAEEIVLECEQEKEEFC